MLAPRWRSIVGDAHCPSSHFSHRPMSEHSFDSILQALASQRQRATYTAVAAVVNTAPRALMVGRPRDAHHSWIVSKQTGKPTGYPADQIAPDLASNPDVLMTREDLLAWLDRVN